MAVLKLGLIADSTIQLQKLESIVSGAGYTVAASLVSSKVLKYCHEEASGSDCASSTGSSQSLLPKVDVWVVRIDLSSDSSLSILEYLEDEPVPIIYDEAESYSGLSYDERIRRLSRKIEASAQMSGSSQSAGSRAKRVWVLAASTGGPDAVTAFLKKIPEDLPDIAFIYVQHIDERMSENLQKVLSRNTKWQVLDCSQPRKINERSVYVVSPEHQLDIDDMASLIPVAEAWSGPYSPSVDQVVGKVARKYGKDSGLIVFSGMGDDGAKTCRLIAHAGGLVWVQSPHSCAVDSMPKEVMATESVSYIGTPELLAREFVNLYQTP